MISPAATHTARTTAAVANTERLETRGLAFLKGCSTSRHEAYAAMKEAATTPLDAIGVSPSTAK
jgi:hypothetical protein